MASLECAPTPRTRCAAALGVALWCAACSDAPPPDAIVRVDTLDGITHTVASDVPEQGGQGLELLWRAPDEASIRTGAEWANPTRIAANERLIAVLDPQLPRVHLFTPEGVRSGSFGRRGGGPGELTNPASLGVHGDSVLVISSLARPALQWFGSDGSYRGSAEGADGEATGGAHFLPESGIVRQTVDLDAGTSSGVGWEYLDLGGSRRSVDLPGDHPLQPHAAGGQAGCWRLGSVGPNLAQVDCTFPLVRVLDPDGRVIREHRIEREPRRTPSDRIETAIDTVQARMRASGEDLPEGMVNELVAQMLERMRAEYAWSPVMHSLTGSVSGHRLVLLEQLPDELGGGPATLHVLDADGRYLVRHPFDRPIRSLAASDTRLVVLVEDDRTGLRKLEAYRLP